MKFHRQLSQSHKITHVRPSFPTAACALQIILGIGALFSSSLNAATYAEPGFILTSIKPLQLIAADITQGVIKADYLLPAGASPHAYSLRPSEVKKIHNASSIYWVGPMLETFMQKPLSKYPLKTFALASLIDSGAKPTAPLVAQPSAELDHDDAEHRHDSQFTDASHPPKRHIHQYQGLDPHLWLSPKMALKIAALIKQQTILLYPQHQSRLELNYQQFKEQLQRLDVALTADLSSLRALGFLVFHDAYARFIEHYQLNQVAALTINPAKRPGAKHLAEIKQILIETKPVCIFSEPQFSSVAIDSVVRNQTIKVAQLDPLATQSNYTDNRYSGFLRDFGQQFIDCLSH
ncbi:MAG: hypothetical protein OFPII_13210 [Osedax symbiont Rs1]|nr:MAG: hypothetical protein OFPII_13210 [Osedax symbiont Rs1]